MQSILDYFPLVAQALMALTVLATVIVKFTPQDKDDLMVDNFKNKLLKLLSYLPTFGINPRTKKLEEALAELQKKEEPKP